MTGGDGGTQFSQAADDWLNCWGWGVFGGFFDKKIVEHVTLRKLELFVFISMFLIITKFLKYFNINRDFLL